MLVFFEILFRFFLSAVSLQGADSATEVFIQQYSSFVALQIQILGTNEFTFLSFLVSVVCLVSVDLVINSLATGCWCFVDFVTSTGQ